MLGQVSGEKKEQFFAETKFFVFPSLPSQGDIEGIPVSLLEALIHGKIVIASDATHVQLLPEWNQLKEAVFLVQDVGDLKELAGALKSVLELSDREIIKRTNNVRNCMKRYEWSNLIHEYFSCLGINS